MDKSNLVRQKMRMHCQDGHIDIAFLCIQEHVYKQKMEYQAFGNPKDISKDLDKIAKDMFFGLMVDALDLTDPRKATLLIETMSFLSDPNQETGTNRRELRWDEIGIMSANLVKDPLFIQFQEKIESANNTIQENSQRQDYWDQFEP